MSTKDIVDDTKVEPADPFDLDALRAVPEQDIAVQTVLTVVPVRKPGKLDFVRVHPDAAYSFECYLYEDKDARTSYLVTPSLVGLVPDARHVRLVTAITRSGGLFLWPLKLATTERSNPWNDSAMEGANLARDFWVRLESSMDRGMYLVYKAQGKLPEPVWPDVPFKELLKKAFGGNIVSTEDHPLVRRARGLD